ncbi:hypothetical protein C3L33_16314, partial [Rhododendron williamsianum]
MMGFGTSGNGGSSSPLSNLSASAPPFSVDRSNSKPNSINPPVNFSEPPYALPFHSSFPNWQYSHHPSASRPDFYPNHRSEVDSIRTTCLPSTDVTNPNFGAASDSFSFLQYSSEVPSKHVGDKSYYPPFVSPVIEDDVPLVALNEPSYDLLSSSLAPLDGPIQVDYSDLEYMPQWDSSWSGLSDLEQGKRVGLGGSFCAEDKNIAGSYVYKNYMKQEDASVVSSGKYVDVFGSESQIVAPSKNKVQNSGFISGDSSRTSISGSSILPESHGQGPFPKPAASFWNHQISYNASYDKCFQPLESCQNEFLSVKKSAPPLVIRSPPSIGTSSTVPSGVSTKDDKNISSVITIKRKGSGFHDSFDQKEPLLHVKRADHFFVASSSTRKVEREYKPTTKDVLDFVSKGEMEFQPADTNVPDGFTLENDNARKAFTSVEDSPESLDHCNPSVDSPCWKGAPASCFSLPEVSETCTSLNRQQAQSFPPSTYDTVKSYEENGYVELGSLLCPEKLSNTNCPVREHTSVDEAKAGFDIPTLTSNKGVQFSNNVGKPRKECGFHNDSIGFPDSKPGHTKELGLEKREVTITYETDFKPYGGLNTNDASEDGSVPLHGMESTSCLPCSAENENKLGKGDATESIPKMNVQMMVNTVHNLSELLLFYWSDDVSAVSEKDHAAIKQAINNLDTCISMKIPPMKPTQESRLPQQGTFCEPNLRKGVTEARSPVTKEPDVSLDSRLDDHHIYKGTTNNNSSGKKVEECADFFSLRDDADIMKDDKMVQAIKGILKEDFIGENEIPSETLLYKNLWLEAEAALCSISYRARFNRMKIEMEKRKSDNVKDVDYLEVDEKEPSSKVSPDWNITQKVTPEAKDNPMSDISIQDSSTSTITKSVDDVEASVMARLDILKCRGQSSNSEDAKGQRLTEVVDVGFAVKSNHFPFVGDRSEAGSLNLSDEFNLQNSCGNSKLDEFGPYISSSYMHSSDDRVIGSGRKKRMGSRIFSGWNDSSSSDWEHVLKDELQGLNPHL